MNKKFFLAAIILVLSLAACGQNKSNETNSQATAQQSETLDNKKLSVVTTIFAPYDFVRAIVGDNADITMLLPPGSESHSFEPTPQDIITVQNSDVFIYVGGESDEWVSGILESMDTENMKVVTLMDCVEVVEEEIIEGMVEEEEEEEGVAYDEHVWTSPKNAKLIVQKISDLVCGLDSENSELYQKNTAAYLSELDKLDADFQNVVDNGQRKTIIFGDRFPFRYFADAYGLEYFAAFPGCSTETDASAATVKFLIDKVNDEKIPAVFHIELGNENMAETIGEATGAKVLLLHACHNITKDDFTSGVTYLEIMSRNVDALREALQ